jgi:hypothetical protein
MENQSAKVNILTRFQEKFNNLINQETISITFVKKRIMANSGIIDQIVDKAAIEQLDKLKKELAENSANMHKLSDEAKALHVELEKISTMKDLLKLMEKNKQILDSATAAERERIKIMNQATQTQAKINAAKTDEARKLEAVKQKIADNNRELRNQVKEQQAASGSIDQMRAKLNQMQSAYDKMSAAMRNSKGGKQAADDIKKLSKEIKELEHNTGRDQRNVGNYFEAIKKGLMGLGLIVGIKELLPGMKEFAAKAIDMAAKAEGITTAFDKLNNPNLLENLRAQTKGTVSDIELMKAAVKADMFNIPADQLGSLLKFAQQRAQETGQSVEYLTESIINGLGRKSKLILDNLGISAAELGERTDKSGDFVTGAIELINEKLKEQGDLAITSADKQQQASVKWQNAMLSVGGKITWMGNLWNKISGSMADWLVKLVNLFAEYGKQIIVVGTAIATYILYVKAATLATKTMAFWQKKSTETTILNTIAIKAQAAYMKVATASTLLWNAATMLLTGNFKGAATAFKTLTHAIKISPIGVLVAGIAAAVAIFALFKSKANEAAKAIGKTIGEFQKNVSVERKEINSLFDSLKKTNEGTAERSRLIQIINEKYGAYLKNQLSEASTLHDIEAAQKSVTKAAIENMAIKAQQDALTPINDNLTKKMQTLGEKTNDFLESWKGTDAIGRYNAEIDKIREEALKWADSEFDEKLEARLQTAAMNTIGISGKRANELFKYVKDLIEVDKLLQKETANVKKTISTYTKAISGDVAVVPEIKNKSYWEDRKKQAEEQLDALDSLKKGTKEWNELTAEIALAQNELAKYSTKDDAKEAKKEADDAQKKIDEVDKRIKDVQKKINDLQFESISEPLKKIADDEERTLQQRLDALRQYYDEKLLLQRIQDDTEEAGIDAEIFAAREKNELALLEKLEKEKTEVVTLNILERQKIETEYQGKINDIQEKQAKKEVEILRGKIKEFQDTLETQQHAEEKALLQQYASGLIEREEYEQKKLEIQAKYSQQSVQTEINLLAELLNIEGVTEKEREKIKEEIRKLELKNEREHLDALEKLRDEDIKKQEEALKKLEEAKKQLRQEAWNFAETLISAQFERQIQRYDAEISKINERKDAEIAALEKSGKTDEEIAEGKAVIEARAEAQTKDIEKRKREAQTRQARFEKAIAVTKATVEGARAVVAALPNIPLSVIIAATTALQVASILAQPIPKYAHGTHDHKGGAAIVGDAYKQEVVIEPSGKTWLTPDKPTLIDIAKHSVVLPNVDELFTPDMRVFDRPQHLANATGIDKAIDAQTKRLEQAIKESQSNLSVNLDSHGIYRISECGQSFKKFTGNNMKYS